MDALQWIERKKEIGIALTAAHKVVYPIYGSELATNDMRHEASEIMTEITKFRQNMSRMKTETIEKRFTKIVDRTSLLSESYIVYRRKKSEDEYQMLLKEHGSDGSGAAAEVIPVPAETKQALKQTFGKKTAEIIHNEKPKKTDKKKTTEIKEGQMKLSLRGGAREGAGRPSKGVKKVVSISLPQENWDEIAYLIQMGTYESIADYFRTIAINDKG